MYSTLNLKILAYKIFFGKEHQPNISIILSGVIYITFALIAVCKEYFLPSLFAIVDRFSFTEDVTGGIIMVLGKRYHK